MNTSPAPDPVLSRLAAAAMPIRNEGLTEQLVRQIKIWALQGLLKPGERLPPERELSAQLKVSRSALRQALNVLQVMGVVEVKHGSGNYLSASAEQILREPMDLLLPLRGVSFAELFESRRAVEAEAAACAAIRGSTADIDKLRAELENMRSNLKNPDVYFRHDVAFHRQIALASGNSVFSWFLELMTKVLSEAWAAKARQGNANRTFAEHRAIFQALRDRNPDEARSAVLAHLTLSKFYSYEPTAVEFRVVARKE